MELNDLYRDVILDHNRRPRNFGPLEPSDASAEGVNPLCGDRLTLRLNLAEDTIRDIRFEGQGCAISTASASLMTEAVKGGLAARRSRCSIECTNSSPTTRRARRISASSRHCPAFANTLRA